MKRFEIILQENHHSILQRESKRRGKTKSQYLRDLITKRAKNKSLNELLKIQTFNCEVLLQISRLSQNINQIAYYLNSNFKVDPEKFFETSKELKKEIEMLRLELNKNSKLLLKVV